MNVGRPIFPLGYKNVPSEVFDLSPDQEHRLRSDGFSWAFDSRALAFGDSTAGRENRLDVVLVKIEEDGNTSTFTRAVPVEQVCKNPNAHLTITGTEIGPELGGDRLVRLRFRDTSFACKPNSLDLRASDFQPATTEVHQLRHMLKSIVVPR